MRECSLLEEKKKKREREYSNKRSAMLVFIDLNRPKKTVVRGSLCITDSVFQP